LTEERLELTVVDPCLIETLPFVPEAGDGAVIHVFHYERSMRIAASRTY
jgi:hypothetical protein